MVAQVLLSRRRAFRTLFPPSSSRRKTTMAKTKGIKNGNPKTKAKRMNRLQADSNEANAVAPREEEGDSDGGGCVNMVGDGKKLALVILFMARRALEMVECGQAKRSRL